MPRVVPSGTLAALAGPKARGSDANATEAVSAKERLRRLDRGTAVLLQTVGSHPFLPHQRIGAYLVL